MSYIVYDLETSGLAPQWNVPLQAALIHCDDNLQPLSELSLRCRLPAHIVPAPGALFTTGIGPAQLEQAPMSSTEMLIAIAKALSAWAPSTVIGYNTIRFDEEMLRHAFFTHLLPPYATQLGGHRRADLLTMVRAVAMLEPQAITVPITRSANRASSSAISAGRTASRWPRMRRMTPWRIRERRSPCSGTCARSRPQRSR
ncbi:MAG: hypothetical protein DI527_17955 [Chelatococcus sp.]|uniref:Exonuclease domain-containing protein n=1 Tax=Bosea massiliensis TaxID=151419 RepID=A0ABW0PAJ1_9HYPH|nr:MAG: hypothetical protein DI527_17955 [Chelatococcus sp.]